MLATRRVLTPLTARRLSTQMFAAAAEKPQTEDGALPACTTVPGAFEAGPGAVGSKGVVRDRAVHQAVCERVASWWGGLDGWEVLGVERSPITGPEGNQEFLIAARRDQAACG